mmetsp:Transcript_12309/g.23363  ORF Transcript_12309/g.23363 Transcript_12309/m.23363 type:complete len:92 (-) Transcript_12309:250-525(-)
MLAFQSLIVNHAERVAPHSPASAHYHSLFRESQMPAVKPPEEERKCSAATKAQSQHQDFLQAKAKRAVKALHLLEIERRSHITLCPRRLAS